MRKQLASLVMVLMVTISSVNGQALFSYGKKQVSKEEFLKAFNKNPGVEADRSKALREYLDLYINFKLKVQAAYDARLQYDANYQFETDNFRKQLASNFINDEANINGLVEEAFTRSRKDIHLQQVFVPIQNNDTTSAYNQVQQLYSDIRSGKSFAQVAALQNDPSATDLGFVTVFTLPYVFENIIYNLPPGKVASPVRSASGYHIFYNAGERPAAGRRKVAQILLAVPPGASLLEKNAVKAKADSLYRVIIHNPAAFDEMVQLFSNDVTTVQNHGELQEFGIGEFSPAFESAAYALKRAGDISLPVETTYGFHILQLKQVIPVAGNLEDPVAAASLRERVEKDDRLTQARKLLVNKWMKLAGFKPATYNSQSLWDYTDSFYNGKNTKNIKAIGDSTVIFTFAKQKITASDFAAYNRSVKAFPMYQSMSYAQLLNEYVKAATTDYYQNHLEDYNPAFRNQLNEFNEANLLFGIMDKEVWTKSTSDEKGLQSYYLANKEKYTWQPSASAIIFTATTEDVLQQLQRQLNNNPGNWKNIADSFGNTVMADSSRFELSQIPVVDRTRFTDGLTTAPVKNNDNSYTFAYIIKVFMEPGQRSFEEARGLVINDYQNVLEQQWLAQLKKKYPVKVNEAVFKKLI